MRLEDLTEPIDQFAKTALAKAFVQCIASDPYHAEQVIRTWLLNQGTLADPVLSFMAQIERVMR